MAMAHRAVAHRQLVGATATHSYVLDPFTSDMSAAYPANSPPSYGAVPSKQYRDNEAESARPLLYQDAEAGPSNPNAIYNQADDVPDDFKVIMII
jgi:hypothetical protein